MPTPPATSPSTCTAVPATTSRAGYRATLRRHHSVAREHAPDYTTDAAPVPGHTDGDGGDLRLAIRHAAAAVERVRVLAADRAVSGNGELAGLLELLATADTCQAAVVELVDRIEAGSLSERRAGLPLEGLLALQSKATFGDRRFLHTVRDVLACMPNVRAAFHAGALGWGQVRAIVCEAGPLTVALRAELDQRFADLDEIRRLQADELVDHVRVAAGRLREDLEQARSVRRVERRYLHVQPDLEGGVRGFAFPATDGALIREALEAAAAPPTGDRDVTRDALDPMPDDATDGAASGSDRAASRDGNAPDAATGDGDVSDPLGEGFDRPRGRQLADAFVKLAEVFLSGHRADGTMVRARPSMTVVTDIHALVGDTEQARRARLLWRLPGAPPALTPLALRRLADDCRMQFVLTDGHEVLGISAPTASIPARLRQAVLARDQGCRFPGCRMPAAWTDLHHVIPREHGGHTVVHNLVALCRRHHTAVTEGRWQLDMTADGTVTVKRGRRRATSDPPLRRHPLTA
ncbi:HNH endonuclease signature motif containing protein [Egicoccus sp. AB-alg2]|uniref:HNH endonuclease signature motif containing protein n=1 Tax=Egicoccus sp. AB-alg2 TaxID=3242693 RepID=UPI00359D3C9D